MQQTPHGMEIGGFLTHISNGYPYMYAEKYGRLKNKYLWTDI